MIIRIPIPRHIFRFGRCPYHATGISNSAVLPGAGTHRDEHRVRIYPSFFSFEIFGDQTLEVEWHTLAKNDEENKSKKQRGLKILLSAVSTTI
jgi:hypothetical protein